jgi:uncharacterized protein (TIGR02444 family)
MGPDASWRWILALYARPEVPPACLHLQDVRGQDVCLLLYALWAGAACGHRLETAEAERLKAVAGPWQDTVVGPLRAVRRSLKHGPLPAPSAETDALRKRLQADEIEAERILLAALAAALPLHPRGAPQAGETARANLRILCPPASRHDEEALDALACAAARVSEGPSGTP